MPITWRNIQGPNYSDAARFQELGAQSLNKGLDQFNRVIGNEVQRRDQNFNVGTDRNTEAALAEITSMQDTGAVDQALASGQYSPQALRERFGAQVDVDVLGKAIAAQTGKLRAQDTTEFNYEQTQLAQADTVATQAEKPAIDGIGQLIALGKFDGAAQALEDSDIRDKGKWFNAIKNARKSSVDAEYNAGQRARELGIQADADLNKEQLEAGESAVTNILGSESNDYAVNKEIFESTASEMGISIVNGVPDFGVKPDISDFNLNGMTAEEKKQTKAQVKLGVEAYNSRVAAFTDAIGSNPNIKKSDSIGVSESKLRKQLNKAGLSTSEVSTQINEYRTARNDLDGLSPNGQSEVNSRLAANQVQVDSDKVEAGVLRDNFLQDTPVQYKQLPKEIAESEVDLMKYIDLYAPEDGLGVISGRQLKTKARQWINTEAKGFENVEPWMVQASIGKFMQTDVKYLGGAGIEDEDYAAIETSILKYANDPKNEESIAKVREANRVYRDKITEFDKGALSFAAATVANVKAKEGKSGVFSDIINRAIASSEAK
jgi:hypothetical protein